ncbi:phosphatase PAP2 family protein [Streptomyces sp900116325]|uniref:phosphatase PAP2 family protein n=1 Tax=Streptomyces sp. 900116325 TaxID=3154295 RepID=UPI0033B95A37
MNGDVHPTDLAAADRYATLWGRWALAAGAVFAALTAAVLTSETSRVPGDLPVHRLLLEHRTSGVVSALQTLTSTGTSVYPYLAAAAAGLIAVSAAGPWAAGRQPAFRAAVLCVAFAGWLALGQTVRFTFMMAIARPRPPAEDWITEASRYSFPSGHATTSAMAAGLLLVALFVRRPRACWLWVGLTVCWAVLVGISRVWLGVHWMSDVVAGWLLAAAWTFFGSAAAAVTGLLGVKPDRAKITQ